MTVGDEPRIHGGIGERVARRTSSTGLIFRRWVGAWIDFIALALLLAAPVLILRPYADGVGRVIVGPEAEVRILIGLLLMLLYFPITEGLWGRSAGKLVSGTIVVDSEGRPPGFGRATVRTLLRLIEVNPFLMGGIPAGIVVMNTKAHQRIGDLLAGTYVVPLSELRAAQATGDSADLKRLANEFA
jgi:uncharacterized RDD family membrane protein YckC